MEIGDVALVKGCLICREEIILLARKTVKKAQMPENGVCLPQVCEKCSKTYLKQGVCLVNPENGALVVIRDQAFRKIFTVPIPEHKIAFVEQGVLDRINEWQKKVK